MTLQVLIVDADASAAEVTRACAERALPGAAVTVEPSPHQGWLSLQGANVTMLIIDPAPYTPAAAQLIRFIHKEFPTARVIVLASAPNMALRRNMQLLGVDAYLEKPVAMP
jgi:DNA-binding NarL/FixJ family response regulator